MRNGTIISRYGLLGIEVALLEEVCHWGPNLRSEMLKPSQLWHPLPAV